MRKKVKYIFSDPVQTIKDYSEKTALGDTLVLVINKHRGDIQWEKSTDSENWIEINSDFRDTLFIGIDSMAYYRAKVTEGTCLPEYSDTILVSKASNKKVSPYL